MSTIVTNPHVVAREYRAWRELTYSDHVAAIHAGAPYGLTPEEVLKIAEDYPAGLDRMYTGDAQAS